MTVGGPIESAILAGRRFSVNNEDAVNITAEGFNNEIRKNGDNTSGLIKSRVPGKVEGLNLDTSAERDDYTFLRELANRLDFFDVTITECNGTVYAGSMQITGDIVYNSQQATTGITLEGTIERQ